MKVSGLAPGAAVNGTEQIPVVQTVGGAKTLVVLSAASLAQAGTRPTPEELQAAITAALVKGAGINFTTDATAGTITIAVDTTTIATVTALNNGLANKQDKSPILANLAGLTLGGNAGKVVKVNAAGDALILDVDLESTTVGTGINDGTYGDVVISASGTKMSVVIATDKVYGAAWSNDFAPATRNAVYTKVESVVQSIAGKVSTTSVGVANGVASLDATGKVPAGQLPSYVDDVLEFATASAFPFPGETGKIYVAQDTERQSRWTGTAYVELTASPGTTDAVPEGSTNKYYTDVRVRAAPMAGLIQTTGAPASTDTLLTVLGKLWRQSFRALTTADMPASVPVMSSDGGIEIGNYIDFHVPTFPDQRDFAARLQAFANGTGFALSCSANALFINGAQVALASDVAGRLSLTAGGNVTGIANFTAGGNISAGNAATNLRAYSDGDTDGAFISFLRNNRYGIYFGLDSDNVVRLGGWSSGTRMSIDTGGNVSFFGNITSSSDRRLKTDIRPLEGAKDIVAHLNGYRFTMNGAPSVGVIAQEVEEVLPELVMTDSDGMKSVDYGKLTAVLIEHNKSLEARLAALEARLAA